MQLSLNKACFFHTWIFYCSIGQNEVGSSHQLAWLCLQECKRLCFEDIKVCTFVYLSEQFILVCNKLSGWLVLL